MLTFGDCKADFGLQRVASVVPTSPEFADYVNSACRRLLRRGDWPGVTQTMLVAVWGDFITWPRYVGSVRKLNVVGQLDVPINNHWWTFTNNRGSSGGWGSASAQLVNHGKSSVFAQPIADGRYIWAYARCQEDYGKKITIYGVVNYGQVLQTQAPLGGWTPGIVLTLGATPAISAVPIRKIDYLLKEATQLPVDIYATADGGVIMEDIGHYEGSETRPSYEVSRLTPVPSVSPRAVEVLAKLRFIPVVNDNDLVIIDNLDALKAEVQALKLQEAGDRIGSLSAQADAVSELNRDLEDQSPEDQFVVVDRPLGHSRPVRNQCF